MKKIIALSLLCQIICANDSTQNVWRYMWANYCQFGNDLKKAEHWYGQITPDAASSYVYLGYIPFLAAHGAYAEIVKLIPALDEQFKTNAEIQLLFALALEKIGKKEEAQRRLVMLNEQYKSNQELAFKVAQIYLERAEPENALKVIDNLLNTSARKPNNYIFYFLKSQVYLQLNKKPEALVAIKQCIEAFPKFDKSWLLYAVLHEQENKIEEAIKGYTTYLETSSESNSEIEHHLLTLVFRQKLLNKKNGSIDDKPCLNTALTLFEKKDYSKALTMIDRCLAQAPDDTQARLMKIQVLASQQEFNQAAQLLALWITNEKEPELWLKTLHLLCYLGLGYNKALQTLQTVQKQKGPSLSLALYMADIALRDNNQTQALHALASAHKMAKNASAKTHIALQTAIIYYDQQKWQLAQKTLEDALALGYYYAPINNLLAYLYATQENNIERAWELISQALAKDQNNPHFLDTKALILYKKNEYDQALTILKTIAQACPTDFTILNHLGKCYFKKGDTALALSSMKAAAQIAKNDNEKLKAESLIAKWSK